MKHVISLRILARKVAQDPPKISKSSRKPSMPLALQAMGDDITSAFDDWWFASNMPPQNSPCVVLKGIFVSA